MCVCVCVSPVLHLQQVADQTVSGAALDEVPLCGEERFGGEAAVFLQEVVEQRQLTLFTHLKQIEVYEKT